MKNDKFRFLLVGCGRIGSRHAAQIASVGTLVAVCDTDWEKSKSLGGQYNVKAYQHIDEMLAAEKDADIISICTPNGLHAEHCIKSLQASLHVLCEKPLCITGVAGWQMLETARYCRRKLFVVKSCRYNPIIQKLASWLANDAGKIYSFHLSCLWNRPTGYYAGNWHGSNFPDGGTLYTQFSHYIDALIWLFGEVQQVSGFRKNNAHQGVIDFEDDGVAALEMATGIIGSLQWSVNTYEKNLEIALTILTENGTVRIGGEYLDDLLLATGTAGTALQKSQSPFAGNQSHHQEIYENLLKALEDEHHFFPGTMEGIKTVEAIEKIYKQINLS